MDIEDNPDTREIKEKMVIREKKEKKEFKS